MQATLTTEELGVRSFWSNVLKLSYFLSFLQKMLTHEIVQLWHLIVVSADPSVAVKGGGLSAPALLLFQVSISDGGVCCEV